MAKVNTKLKKEPVYTHGRARAASISIEKQLERSVMSCLLFEDEFYEDGVTISTRIADLASKVKAPFVADLAVKARSEGNLRHVPLWLCVSLAKRGYNKLADVLYEVIQRPDEISEFLALYWRDGKCPIANQVKKGLGRAFTKFDEYQLSKWN